MNYLNRLSPITLVLFLLVIFGCNDDLQDNNYNRYNTVKGTCLAPEAIGVEDYVTTISGMDGIKYVWDEVEGALGYEFRLNVNSEITPIVSTLVGMNTTYTIESLFEIDDLITAKVRTVCDKGSTSEWVEIASVNRNGGATVDDIPSIVDWNFVCNVSPCEYMRFIDNEVTNCNGDAIPLGVGYGGKNFYLKSDVCPCLYQTTLCDGLETITECLQVSYLKRNYTTCN